MVRKVLAQVPRLADRWSCDREVSETCVNTACLRVVFTALHFLHKYLFPAQVLWERNKTLWRFRGLFDVNGHVTLAHNHLKYAEFARASRMQPKQRNWRVRVWCRAARVRWKTERETVGARCRQGSQGAARCARGGSDIPVTADSRRVSTGKTNKQINKKVSACCTSLYQHL